MPRIDEKKYEDMIQELNSFHSTVINSSEEMLSTVETCAQGLGDDDPAATASLRDIKKSALHYKKAALKAKKIADAMTEELEEQRKEREVWNDND